MILVKVVWAKIAQTTFVTKFAVFCPNVGINRH